MDSRQRMEELYKLLAYHNERYYNQDEPEISDYEYDQLSLELRRLEAEHPEWNLAEDDGSGGEKLPPEVRRSLGFLLASRGYARPVSYRSCWHLLLPLSTAMCCRLTPS